MNSSKLIQKQLDAYNTKNLEALLATYALDAEHYDAAGNLLAKGHEVFRKNFTERFKEPDLHAKLIHRACVGNHVFDHEVITRNFAEGKGTLEVMCIYEIKNDLIVKATFIAGEKVIF